MRKAPSRSVLVLALLAVAAGCSSVPNARQKPTTYTPSGSFTDLSERSSYIDRRATELMKQGLKPQDAAARASREWFAHASVAEPRPTKSELKRRAAEADLVDFLEKEKDDRSR